MKHQNAAHEEVYEWLTEPEQFGVVLNALEDSTNKEMAAHAILAALPNRTPSGTALTFENVRRALRGL